MPTPTPELLDALAARGDVFRGTAGSGLRTESTGIAALDAQLPGRGWPAGALSELLVTALGIGELGLLLPLAARLTQAGRHAALVAPPQLPYAPALARAGLALSRTLVVEPPTGEEGLWAAEQLLRCSAYGAVCLWTSRVRDADLRRLQLAAETGGGVGLLLRPARSAAASSVAALRLQLERRDGRLVLTVLKARGGRAGRQFDLTPEAA
jgi:hypothetical protein